MRRALPTRTHLEHAAIALQFVARVAFALGAPCLAMHRTRNTSRADAMLASALVQHTLPANACRPETVPRGARHAVFETVARALHARAVTAMFACAEVRLALPVDHGGRHSDAVVACAAYTPRSADTVTLCVAPVASPTTSTPLDTMARALRTNRSAAIRTSTPLQVAHTVACCGGGNFLPL